MSKNPFSPKHSLPLDQYKLMVHYTEIVRRECEKFGLIATLASAKTLTDVLKKATKGDTHPAFGELMDFSLVSAAEFANYSTQIRTRIPDELSSIRFVEVARNKIAYWEYSSSPFGDKVRDTFGSSADEEIVEAGKCLAVDRTTACVFHLMRAMEIVVTRLGSKLQVTLIDKNNIGLVWGKIVGNMNDKIDSMPKGPEQNKWSESVSLLRHVGKSWRNDTMHQKKTYTESEAQDVYNAVKAFMIDLSDLV
jgi:hypothetical protein